MKIVRLTENFPSEINRGLAPNVYYISREQVKQGHQVWVFAFTKDKTLYEEKDGIKIYRIKKPRLVRWFGGVTFAKAINKEKINPDIVHGLNCIPFGWFFLIMKKILPTKYVMSIHGSINPLLHGYAYGLVSKLRNWEFSQLCRFLARKVDLVIPITNIIKDELIQAGIIERNIKVISPGIDTNIFKTPQKQKDIDPNNLKLLYVGRFSQMKGLKYLVKACKLLKNNDVNFSLSLIGGTKQDDDFENIQYLVKKYRLDKNITIIKPINQKELVKFYQNSDIFILTSVHEPYGKVILEAMACNLPTIATKSGAAADLIKNKHNGILIDQKNHRGIYNAIILLLSNNAEKYQSIANFCKENIDQYDWKNVSYKYSESFQSLEA